MVNDTMSRRGLLGAIGTGAAAVSGAAAAGSHKALQDDRIIFDLTEFEQPVDVELESRDGEYSESWTEVSGYLREDVEDRFLDETYRWEVSHEDKTYSGEVQVKGETLITVDQDYL